MSSKELSVTRLAILHKKKRNRSGHCLGRAKFAGIPGFGDKNSNEAKQAHSRSLLALTQFCNQISQARMC